MDDSKKTSPSDELNIEPSQSVPVVTPNTAQSSNPTSSSPDITTVATEPQSTAAADSASSSPAMPPSVQAPNTVPSEPLVAGTVVPSPTAAPSPGTVSPEASTSNNSTVNNSQYDAKPKKHLSAPVVLLAVLGIAVLIGGALFLFLESQTSETPTANPAAVETETAPADEVDEASQAIDENLDSIDDSEDFNEDDLSDTTLSL